jgi:hypothetical protein
MICATSGIPDFSALTAGRAKTALNALEVTPTIHAWVKKAHQNYIRSYGSGAEDEEHEGSYHEDFKTPEKNWLN